MARTILKILGGIVILLVLCVGSIAAWGLTHWDRTFTADEPAIHASTDSAVIARGRYLAYGPARCVECHVAGALRDSALHGATPPLSGGFEFNIPVGTFRTPNLTPDSVTGIGRWTDGQVTRAIRHGVRHDGRVLVPFMEFQNLSDDDLTAIVSFLRSQPPVRHEVADHTPNFAGKLVLSFLIKPTGPTGTPPAHSPADSATTERGAYLVNHVASCGACHTKRNKMDGSYIGGRLAGGDEFPGSEFANDSTPVGPTFVSPNLTPARAGRITEWTEQQFVTRFRSGSLLPGSPMPWPAFGRMTDNDLRAIYRYLKTVPAIENDPGPSMKPAGS